MSILIKDMEMPKTCTMCWLSPICPVWVKEVSRYKGYDNRLPNCPLVEVSPHGRLIDADELLEIIKCLFKDLNSFENFMYNHGVGDSIATIENAPTIIEAEEGKEDE